MEQTLTAYLVQESRLKTTGHGCEIEIAFARPDLKGHTLGMVTLIDPYAPLHDLPAHLKRRIVDGPHVQLRQTAGTRQRWLQSTEEIDSKRTLPIKIDASPPTALDHLGR